METLNKKKMEAMAVKAGLKSKTKRRYRLVGVHRNSETDKVTVAAVAYGDNLNAIRKRVAAFKNEDWTTSTSAMGLKIRNGNFIAWAIVDSETSSII